MTVRKAIINLGLMNEEGAALFKQQRRLLSSLQGKNILTNEENELLEGLMYLCDHIADELHDRYGFDTLFCSSSESFNEV